MLAAKSGADVIPIAHNAGYLWPRNTLIKKPGNITLVIGPLIESANKNAKQITQEVEDWIESTVNNLPDPELMTKP
jgi:1-acyl-sn-glycerol-3-phosphate acyltransferase